MPTTLSAATSTTGSVIDPTAGDGTLVIKTGATAGAQVNALSFAANGDATFLGAANAPTMQQGGVAMPRMVLSTAQTTTSGTSALFTGIPSWAKRVTLILAGFSTAGTNNKLVQLGTSGGIVSSGYTCSFGYCTTAVAPFTATNGFQWIGGSAAEIISGSLVFTLVTGNTWACSSTLSIISGTQPGMAYTGGYIALGASLDRIQLLAVGGTDTFDGGSVNILIEG